MAIALGLELRELRTHFCIGHNACCSIYFCRNGSNLLPKRRLIFVQKLEVIRLFAQLDNRLREFGCACTTLGPMLCKDNLNT
jgi:hypothetical protein